MSLRRKLIRLAYAKPELRDSLLPFLKQGASSNTAKLITKAKQSVGQLLKILAHLSQHLNKDIWWGVEVRSMFAPKTALGHIESMQKEFELLLQDLAVLGKVLKSNPGNKVGSISGLYLIPAAMAALIGMIGASFALILQMRKLEGGDLNSQTVEIGKITRKMNQLIGQLGEALQIIPEALPTEGKSFSRRLVRRMARIQRSSQKLEEWGARANS